MKNGGSAFPILDTTHASDINSLACIEGGMTLLDYFAGQTLVGLLSFYNKSSPETISPKALAEKSYWIAKAMIDIKAELTREKETEEKR